MYYIRILSICIQSALLCIYAVNIYILCGKKGKKKACTIHMDFKYNYLLKTSFLSLHSINIIYPFIVSENYKFSNSVHETQNHLKKIYILGVKKS